MEKKVKVPASVECSEDKEFEIRILRDSEERPAVVCCKIPRPQMGLSFDITVFNVGTKDVRVTGKVEEEAKKVKE